MISLFASRTLPASSPLGGRSYWQRHGGAPEASPGGNDAGNPARCRDPLPRRADVVIIGGGFAGLSTAVHLAEAEPAASIVLLEAHFVGFGASGRNAGLLSSGGGCAAGRGSRTRSGRHPPCRPRRRARPPRRRRASGRRRPARSRAARACGRRRPRARAFAARARRACGRRRPAPGALGGRGSGVDQLAGGAPLQRRRAVRPRRGWQLGGRAAAGGGEGEHDEDRSDGGQHGKGQVTIP